MPYGVLEKKKKKDEGRYIIYVKISEVATFLINTKFLPKNIYGL